MQIFLVVVIFFVHLSAFAIKDVFQCQGKNWLITYFKHEQEMLIAHDKQQFEVFQLTHLLENNKHWISGYFKINLSTAKKIKFSIPEHSVGGMEFKTKMTVEEYCLIVGTPKDKEKNPIATVNLICKHFLIK